MQSQRKELNPDHFQKRAKQHRVKICQLQEMVRTKVEIGSLREAAKELKEEIRIDMDWGSAASRKDGLSIDENSALAAIWQAGCSINFKWNSNPTSSRWFEHLDEAETDLSDYR